MTAVDRVVVGLTLMVLGAGVAVLDWPWLLWVAPLGFGLGVFAPGVVQLINDRKRQSSGDPR